MKFSKILKPIDILYFFIAIASLLTACSIQAAGLVFFTIPADEEAKVLHVAQWSPCAKPNEIIERGPFRLHATRDCPVKGSRLPLIIVSHGYRGSFLSHHDTAETLADNGFIVVALNHPDDSVMGKGETEGIIALKNRPTDIKRLIDYMLNTSPIASQINPQQIGFFGFSRGSYTGLVLAGAVPNFSTWHHPFSPCSRTKETVNISIKQPQDDKRIKALVIADPLNNGLFANPSSLETVNIPLQLWRSEYGGDGVMPNELATMKNHFPQPPEDHLVSQAGHFSFLNVCPDNIQRQLPRLCHDQKGFDRADFHRRFNAEILRFFRQTLLH